MMKIFCDAIGEAIVTSCTVVEEISGIAVAEIHLLAPREVSISDVVNSEATLRFEYENGRTRYFGGFIECASIKGTLEPVESSIILHIRVVSNCARMGYFHKSEIFLDSSDEDVIELVLKSHMEINYCINLKFGNPRKMDMTFQYDESDLHFVSRIIHRIGAYWHVSYDGGKETFYVCDNSQSSQKIQILLNEQSSYSSAAYNASIIFDITLEALVGYEKYNSFSYNDMQARVVAGSATDTADVFKIGEKRVYDRHFLDESDGDRVSKMKLDGCNCESVLLTCQSFCPEISPGMRFTVSGARVEDHNGEFFAISVKHYFDRTSATVYRNEVRAIPASVQFRPHRRIEKKVFGCLTATVTGGKDGEVCCDDFGRVRVSFHCVASQQQSEDRSSCWVPVAYPGAGNDCGLVIIPRCGYLVLIAFDNGDPDLPFIVGNVFNGINRPPANYPQNQNSISAFRISSFGGSGGYNELSFDSKQGSERVFFHAQKDLHVHVEDGNLTVNLQKGNQNTTLTTGNYEVSIEKGNCILNVAGSIKVVAKEGIEVVSEKDISFTCKGDLSFECDGKMSSQAGSASFNAQGSCETECQSMQIQSRTDVAIKAMQIQVEAQASFKVTSLSIEVTAKAAVAIKASAAVSVEAGGALMLKGATIALG
jgi:type VI secretion system secreted protein VgrG